MTLADSSVAQTERPPFLTANGQPRAFVIVSSARSGSNLLVGYLRQLREAACFGEILRSDFVDKPGWQKLVGRLDLPGAARELHVTDLTAFWDLFLGQGLRRRATRDLSAPARLWCCSSIPTTKCTRIIWPDWWMPCKPTRAPKLPIAATFA